MDKKVLKKTLVKACAISFILGVALVYFAAVRPLNTEVVQYRAAAFWINFLNQNPVFGYPVGAAWDGSDYVVVYPTGYRLVVPSAEETYALRPDGTKAVNSFRIFPPPDVRRHKLENIAGH